MYSYLTLILLSTSKIIESGGLKPDSISSSNLLLLLESCMSIEAAPLTQPSLYSAIILKASSIPILFSLDILMAMRRIAAGILHLISKSVNPHNLRHPTTIWLLSIVGGGYIVLMY